MEEKEANNDQKQKKPIIIRNSTDLQRLRLEKLMSNPDKPVVIPEKSKERGIPNVPDFVRNVMGSSAGAGSGEFHVYRHLRRKEYARQKYMKEKAEKEKMEEEYHLKLEENRRKAEEKTAKKRQKRLRKKQKQKEMAKRPKLNKPSSEDNESESEHSASDSKEDSVECTTENDRSCDDKS
ncbi:hypothetical protein NQ315_016682 [Exocentrus adspersus]|uniref:PRKR-interacting protein 1 n=1 Tax=Exocentrus adspersus TaxID=1586481 RepID=A0AAV8VPM7_9CUCU|nr:hypothetical protein NQ315_016682 [Exocentrus adspersus]